MCGGAEKKKKNLRSPPLPYPPPPPLKKKQKNNQKLQARYYSDPAFLLRVPASAFLPPPRVNSALVSFALRDPGARGDPAPAADERALGAVIAAAFAQRRKKLRNALAPLFGGDAEGAGAALSAVGVDPDGRADAAGVDVFVRAAGAVVSGRADGG